MKNVIKIIGLDHYGRGIGKSENKTVFIDNALITEEVEIEITKNKKNYSEALVTKYIKTSSNRVVPKCPYYEECGGCNIMHMEYSSQLQFKENKVKEILKKFADIDESTIKNIVPTKELNYRNKVTLQVKEKIGLYKKTSYELININECLICNHKINKIIKILNNINLNGINQIIIKVSDYSEEIMIVFYLEKDINEEKIINELKGSCTNIIVKYKNKSKALYGTNYITEKIGDYLFRISADSFFQVNNDGMHKLYELVKEHANIDKKSNVLDLYCGTGTIGIYLSNTCNNVIGIEINEYAVKDAIKNKEINHINNIDFICDDVSNIIDKYKDIDTVIVDPPRSGLNSGLIANVLNINPKKVIYVSCDPITLARDLKQFKELYDINMIIPVDMFTNTYHVECVAVLNKKEE